MGDTLKGIILQQEGDNRKSQKRGNTKWTSVAEDLVIRKSLSGYSYDILYFDALSKDFSRYDFDFGTVVIEALYWMSLPDMPKECEV